MHVQAKGWMFGIKWLSSLYVFDEDVIRYLSRDVCWSAIFLLDRILSGEVRVRVRGSDEVGLSLKYNWGI